MGHNHSHTKNRSRENISFAFGFNLGFSILEFVGGYFTNSVAIMSDALHDLGDSLSLGLAWYFQKISAWKRTKYFTYVDKRFSIWTMDDEYNILSVHFITNENAEIQTVKTLLRIC
ncbi:cation transporter [Leptospira vanthielii]|uniref:Cation efflux domain protein n=1 Tax=Leptospira vanthielii serovar Holland str. Waz Holland = ATCC 700522 TaxID=1218591 RepID=N1WCS5_9LEPT|nr:cation transporter [Leptospira vanthielii]EMY71225.1 cation efflux domain protein [Leptospira vanthielii serovar Holland str. Waz Holland = ATCC 700522]